MAKLSAAARKKLPASTFAGPDRSFPIPDKSHAANAKSRVADKSPALKAKVDAAANKVLGKDKSGPPAIDKKTLGSMAKSLNFNK
jgi:hypothetical protein